MNLNYKPENKDKDSSEILLEYIKNDYWYKQGHKSKNYILSNEIISEYFKKKDYIGLQRKISEYVQQYDIKKACEQYFVTIEEDFRYPFIFFHKKKNFRMATLPFSLKRKFNVKRIIFIIFCYVISE